MVTSGHKSSFGERAPGARILNRPPGGRSTIFPAILYTHGRLCYEKIMGEGIFITGAAGKTGLALLERLRGDRGAARGDITCLLRPGGDRGPLEHFGVQIVEGNAADPDAVAAAWTGQETVLHLSSILHAGAVVRGTRGARRLVAVSSAGRYSRFRDIAGAIVAGEKAVERSAAAWTILRPTMIYGVPGDRNISRLAALVARARILPLPGGNSRFQPVLADDLAGAIVAALDRPSSEKRSYDVSGGSAHTLAGIVRILAGLMGRRVVVLPVPLALARAAVRLLGRVTDRPAIDPSQIDRLLEDRSLPHEEAARDLYAHAQKLLLSRA